MTRTTSTTPSPRPPDPPYLVPYVRAAAVHGDGFASLLWATPETQSARFDAFVRLCGLHDRNLLDVGCGRADLLDHLLGRGIRPAHYVGIEAVGPLVEAAARKRRRDAVIVAADFVREPSRMLVGADVVLFSGSLNTLGERDFRTTLGVAFSAATEAVVFNFLCSPHLAAAEWLHWRGTAEVLAFARTLTPEVASLEDYLEGDCTVAMFKAVEGRAA